MTHRLFAFTLFTLCALVPLPHAQDGAVSLGFTVLDAVSGEPVPDAIVYFHPYATTSATDADGIAMFDTASADIGYWYTDTPFEVSVWHPDHPLLTSEFVAPGCGTCSSYTISTFMIELGLNIPQSTTPTGYVDPDCGATRQRVEVERMPCEAPYGQQLACVLYYQGVPFSSLNDVFESSSYDTLGHLEDNVKEELRSLGARVNCEEGGDCVVTKTTRARASLGVGEYMPGTICGEHCLRTSVTKVTIRTEEWHCGGPMLIDQYWPIVPLAGWVWVGTESTYVAGGLCHDDSGLYDC